jgi:peroxiredoxin
MRSGRTLVLLTGAPILIACATPSVPTASTARSLPATSVLAPPPVVVTPAAPSPVALLHPRGATPWLGVELRARATDLAGVEILSVFRGSPAFGVLESGDVLLSVDGKAVLSPPELTAAIRGYRLGDEVGLIVERAGIPKILRLKLDGMPEFEDRVRLEFVGRPAPEITPVVAFQGEHASLGELRGKVVIVEFWASFCGTCRYIGPLLDSWHRTLAPSGLAVVGITMDPPDSGAEAAARSQMTYSLASDLHGEVTKRFHANQIPMLLIVDRSGIVRDVVVGYSSERLAETKALVGELLEQRAVDGTMEPTSG